jgi:hypothetical protein
VLELPQKHTAPPPAWWCTLRPALDDAAPAPAAQTGSGVRHLIASTLGRVPDAPSVVTVGCGHRVPLRDDLRPSGKCHVPRLP